MLKLFCLIFFIVNLLATVSSGGSEEFSEEFEPTERPFVNILRKQFSRQQLFNLIRQINQFENLHASVHENNR